MPLTLPSKSLIAVLAAQISLASPAMAAGNKCEGLWLEEKSSASRKPVASASPTTEQQRFSEASARLLKYSDSLQKTFLERGFVMDGMIEALLAELPVLLIGPPGNAKTALGKAILLNIVDEKTGKPSYYSMQMTQETTLSDTHGSINYKVLSEEGHVQRNYDEGMLGARNVFVDEVFDIRAGAVRNLLEVMAERAHSQGTRQHKGLTEFFIGATNKTFAEVFAEANNSDGPRAQIDRYAYVFLIPKEADELRSKRSIFTSTRTYNEPISQITFQQLENLRSYLPQVQIPQYIADLASLIQYRLGPKFESEEKKSKAQYREKFAAGENPLPPYRSTKYMSDRTLSAAGQLLKAIVVLDYIKSGGQRPLTATTEDLAKLRRLYRINTADPQVMERQFKRAIKDEDIDQNKSAKLERDITEATFDETLKEFNDTLTSLKLQDLDQKIRDYNMLSSQERRLVADLLKALYQRSLTFLNKNIMEDVTGESIAYETAFAVVQEYAHLLFADKTANVLAAWDREKNINPATFPHRKAQKLRYRYSYTRPQTDIKEKPMSAAQQKKAAEEEARKWWVKARAEGAEKKSADAKGATAMAAPIAKAEVKADATVPAATKPSQAKVPVQTAVLQKAVQLIDQAHVGRPPLVHRLYSFSHVEFEPNDLRRASQMTLSPDFNYLYFISPTKIGFELMKWNIERDLTGSIYTGNSRDIAGLVPVDGTVVVQSAGKNYVFDDAKKAFGLSVPSPVVTHLPADPKAIYEIANNGIWRREMAPGRTSLQIGTQMKDFGRAFEGMTITAGAVLSPTSAVLADSNGNVHLYANETKYSVPYSEQKDLTGTRFVALTETDVLMFPPTSSNTTYPVFLTLTKEGHFINPYSGNDPLFWTYAHQQYGNALHASVDQTGTRVVVVEAEKIEIFDKASMLQVLRSGNADLELKPLLTIRNGTAWKYTAAYLRADGKLIIRTDKTVEIYDLAKH